MSAASFVCTLDDDALFCVSGDDAASFLHGQLAGEVRELGGEARDLAYCSPKGRVLALPSIFEHEGAIHMALPADAAEASLQRLRMMVLRAKVVIERVDEEIARIGVAGEAALDASGVTLLDLPGPHPRVELVGPRARIESLRDDLERALGARPSIAWRLLDIRAGRPRLHAASVDLYLPQFLNLEQLGGVSFEKGCFPGQEVVARTHYLGKVVRRTRRARVAVAEAPAPGTPLRALTSGQDKEGGRVLFAAPAENGMELLAVIPESAVEAGASLHLADAEGPRLELLDLPYAL